MEHLYTSENTFQHRLDIQILKIYKTESCSQNGQTDDSESTLAWQPINTKGLGTLGIMNRMLMLQVYEITIGP